MRLYIQLGAYWFFGSAALGLYFPYFSLYLRENVGLLAWQVGIVVALPPLMGLFAQPAWGQLADRSGSRARTLSLLCAGAGFGFVALSTPQSFLAALACTALFACFASALVPMGISVSLGALEQHAQHGFGRVRVWGTIGFLCAILAAPPLLSTARAQLGLLPTPRVPQPALGLLLLLSALAVWVAGVIAWRLPSTTGLLARAAPREYLLLLRQRNYRRVLLFTFLSYLSLHGPMIMFPLYVRERGGDVAMLGRMWVGMLLVEIPVMLYSGAIFARLGPRRMLSLATAAGALRWGTCGLTTNLTLAFAVQLLHAAVVTGVLIGGALYVESLVPQQLRSTAQSGLTMFGNGVGGVLAGALAGLVLEHFGMDALFLGSGLAGLSTAVLGLFLLPSQESLHAARNMSYAGKGDEAA